MKNLQWIPGTLLSLYLILFYPIKVQYYKVCYKSHGNWKVVLLFNSFNRFKTMSQNFVGLILCTFKYLFQRFLLVLNHLEAVFFINHLYFSIDFRERCMLIIINNLMDLLIQISIALIEKAFYLKYLGKNFFLCVQQYFNYNFILKGNQANLVISIILFIMKSKVHLSLYFS